MHRTNNQKILSIQQVMRRLTMWSMI